MNTVIRPRRLLVSGAGKMSPRAAQLWRELGALLAREEGLVVVTGGLEGHKELDWLTADFSVVSGMLGVLKTMGVPPDERIETVHPDPSQDWEKLKRFNEGRVRVLTKRNPQARRFSMVNYADVVISIEGDTGTRSVLDVAMAIERPVLPLPFGGDGASKKVWREQRDEILRWFQIQPDEAAAFEKIKLDELDDAGIRQLAVRVRNCLLRGFTQSCFVIMRFHEESDPVFDQAIAPALANCGLKAWRTDRTVATGDVVAAIRDGINHCYFAIADTTSDRPNVMYELGLAHAVNKPVILLRKLLADGSFPKVPFDFQNQSILTYTDDLASLRERLIGAISTITMKSRV